MSLVTLIVSPAHGTDRWSLDKGCLQLNTCILRVTSCYDSWLLS